MQRSGSALKQKQGGPPNCFAILTSTHIPLISHIEIIISEHHQLVPGSMLRYVTDIPL